MATLNSTTKLSQLVWMLPAKRLHNFKKMMNGEECKSFCLGFSRFWWNSAVLVLVGFKIPCVLCFVFLVGQFISFLLLVIEVVPHFADDACELGHFGLRVIFSDIAVNILAVEEVSSECSFGRGRSRTGSCLAGFCSICLGDFWHLECKWYNWIDLRRCTYSFRHFLLHLAQLSYTSFMHINIK